MTEISYLYKSVRLDDASGFDASFEPQDGPPYLILLRGKCPRCRHETEQGDPLVLSEAFAADNDDDWRTRAKAAADTLRRLHIDPERSQQREIVMVCDCATHHPKTPEGKNGCGAAWTINATW